MSSHDSSSSKTSRVLTVPSLQPYKVEVLIAALADFEVLSMIKFLNAQSRASIEIFRQLCQVYGRTLLDGQQFSCRRSTGRCLIISPYTSHPVISIFSYTSRNSCPVSISVFRMTESCRWVSQWFEFQAVDFYDTGYKIWPHGMKKSQFRRSIYIEKIAKHLMYTFQ